MGKGTASRRADEQRLIDEACAKRNAEKKANAKGHMQIKSNPTPREAQCIALLRKKAQELGRLRKTGGAERRNQLKTVNAA